MVAISLAAAADLQPLPLDKISLPTANKPTNGNRWKSLRKFNHIAIPDAERIEQETNDDAEEVAGITTETLAQLFTKQGQYERAIKIYEKLSLVNPDKSVFFAATIEELKKKHKI
ncbi:MAG: tetratricopeptide repeat protein [Saprospiraceae bacterium]